jgi:hypothetical protein
MDEETVGTDQARSKGRSRDLLNFSSYQLR